MKSVLSALTGMMLLAQTGIAGTNSATVLDPFAVPDFNIPYHAVTQDTQGFVYLAGPASSAHGVTPQAYDTTYNGGAYDIFVAKFAPRSLKPVAVTLLGGAGEEWCRAMMIDQDGNVVLTGSTNSPDFAKISGSAEGATLKEQTAFVVRLDRNLEKLSATNLLGPGTGFALAASPDGGLYVAGEFSPSSSFPVPPEKGWDPTYNGGGNDAFVAKLDVGLFLANLTFIGGSGRELALTMAAAETGDVIVAGFSDSKDFPRAGKTLYNAPADRSGNGFVARFSPDLKTLQAAAQLGGSEHDIIHALAVGRDESIYLTGLTLSPDFPVTPGAYDESYNGDADIFVCLLDGNLDNILASTYAGGAARDWAFAIALNDDQNVYVAGDTDSGNFTGSAGSVEKTAGEGLGDIIVARMNGTLTTLDNVVFAGGKMNERLPVLILGRDNQTVMAGLASTKKFSGNEVPAEELQGKETYHLILTLGNETVQPIAP
jgi:hypothetical protein